VVTQTRWANEGSEKSRWLIERFRRLSADGHDLGGEARFMDTLMPRHATILDAGCGTGRVAAFLARCGHHVVGVDADPELIEAARADHPELDVRVGNLVGLAEVLGATAPFDGAVVVGNVMPYLAPDTETEVLGAIAAHLKADAPIVVGFGAAFGYAVTDFDAHAAAAGLSVEQRFSTWDLRPWRPESEFTVTVLRTPAGLLSPEWTVQ